LYPALADTVRARLQCALTSKIPMPMAQTHREPNMIIGACEWVALV